MNYEKQHESCMNSDYRHQQESPYPKSYDDWCKYDSGTGNPCYITTAVCDILGYTDQCLVLTEMRKFRNHVMQKEPKYFNVLLEGDMVGPLIASEIKKDFMENHDKDTWTRFYQLYLSETANLVASSHYEEAIIKYQAMIHILKEHFGISDVDFTLYQKCYDTKNSSCSKLKMLQALS